MIKLHAQSSYIVSILSVAWVLLPLSHLIDMCLGANVARRSGYSATLCFRRIALPASLTDRRKTCTTRPLWCKLCFPSPQQLPSLFLAARSERGGRTRTVEADGGHVPMRRPCAPALHARPGPTLPHHRRSRPLSCKSRT